MKLLLFDIDGTLIRSHGIGRAAFERAIEEVLGLPRALANVPLGGKTDPLILEESLKHAGWTGAAAHELSERVFSCYLGHLEEGLKHATHYQVLPGVREILQTLSGLAEMALALGTGNIEAGARLKLGRGQLNPFFPTGGFGSDATDRANVLRAGVRKAKAHYATEFTSVWVIGDTPADVEAARAIGAKALAVATGDPDTTALVQSKPDVLVDTLVEPQALTALVQG